MRDWMYVDDHGDALLTVLELGALGRSYNTGGDLGAAHAGLPTGLMHGRTADVHQRATLVPQAEAEIVILVIQEDDGVEAADGLESRRRTKRIAPDRAGTPRSSAGQPRASWALRGSSTLPRLK